MRESDRRGRNGAETVTRVTVHLTAALRAFADGLGSVEIEIPCGELGRAGLPQGGREHRRWTPPLSERATVAAVLEALWRAYPGVRDRVLTEQGEVRPHVNVFVGPESIRFTGGLATSVPDGAEISILPAVSGG